MHPFMHPPSRRLKDLLEVYFPVYERCLCIHELCADAAALQYHSEA